MKNLTYKDLIGTPFSQMARALLDRQNWLKKNKHLSSYECELEFPKPRCPIENCGLPFKLLTTYSKHIQEFHGELLNPTKSTVPSSTIPSSTVPSSTTSVSLQVMEVVEDGTVEDGIVEDGAADDGAADDVNIEDGAAEDDNEDDDVEDDNIEDGTVEDDDEDDAADDVNIEDGAVEDDADSESDNSDVEELEKIFTETDTALAANSYYGRKVAFLSDDQKQFIHNYISNLAQVRLTNNIPNKHVEAIADVITTSYASILEITNPLFPILTKYSASCNLQDQYLMKQDSYVKPVTIELAGIPIQYFPIEKLIACIINKFPYLVDSIEKEKLLTFTSESDRRNLSTNLTFSSELDTVDEDFFDRICGKFRIEISIDDFSFLGKGGRKFTAGYLSCCNLPIEHRSSRDENYLFLLVNRPKQSNIMNIILRPFLEDMKRLERHGINVKKSDGSTVNMKVGLAKLICDNLAQNEILGFKMSFGQGSICRECLTKREDYKTSRMHGLFDYSNVTFECLPRPEKRIRPNDYGLKNECILTELGGVNIGNIMPPDMFHDLHGKFWLSHFYSFSFKLILFF